MKTFTVPGLALLCATMAAAFVVNAAGCSDRSASVCDALCDCQECTNRQYEDCLDDTGDSLRKADNKACTGPTDAYLSCVESNLQCAERKIDISSCDTEFQDVLSCGSTPPAFAATCELGLRRLKECLGDDIVNQFGTCEQPFICGMACYANVDCADIQTGMSPELSQCVSQAQCNGGGFPDSPPSGKPPDR